MKKITNCLIGFFLSAAAFAQPPEFEGKLVYKTTVRSRSPQMPASILQRLLFATDSVTVYVKNGHYRYHTELTDEYYLPRDQKVYVRFKGLDTLYYRDYSDDTTTVQYTRKESGNKRIAGYDCAAFTLATASDTTHILYAPELYVDPETTKNLLLGHQNIVSEQTRSIGLASETRAQNYVLTQTCLRVQSEKLDSQVFAPPALPLAKLDPGSLVKAPVFAGKGTWATYLQKNMDAKVLTSSLKIKKKETFAEQVVTVAFVVSKSSEITDVRVVTEGKIHPALKEEAIRLVQGSKWKPAVVAGEKIDFPLTQLITFRVEQE